MHSTTGSGKLTYFAKNDIAVLKISKENKFEK